MSALDTGPSLDSLLSQARGLGWDFFDGPRGAPDARADQETAKTERVALLAAALYDVPEFRELLDFLADMSLRRLKRLPPLVGVDPIQNYCYGVFRDGQDAMVTAIFKLIAQGRDQQLKGRDP